MSKSIETPWGPSQTSEEVAPGIVRHDTASHGGFYLSPARVAEMPKPLRDFKPFAGSNWYEEDCDWCIVALSFPQLFPAQFAPIALATLKQFQPAVFERFAEWKAKRVAAS